MSSRNNIWVDNELCKIQKNRSGPRTSFCLRRQHRQCNTIVNQQIHALASKAQLAEIKLRGICTCPCHDGQQS